MKINIPVSSQCIEDLKEDLVHALDGKSFDIDYAMYDCLSLGMLLFDAVNNNNLYRLHMIINEVSHLLKCMDDGSYQQLVDYAYQQSLKDTSFDVNSEVSHEV